jgi:O-methyltransferase
MIKRRILAAFAMLRRPPGIMYEDVRERFIRNGSNGSVDPHQRRELLRRFETIDRNVPIKSTPTDALFIAEAMLSIRAAGDVIECGCFSGGSTAKISLLAALLKKRLFVFDSFEGLPGDDASQMSDLSVRSERPKQWRSGGYAGTLAQVSATVKTFGNADVCTFVPGWFRDSLTPRNLPDRVCLAFTDVDLPASARECLRALWPRLARGGVYFSHDVAFVRVLQELYDPRLWSEELKESPPVLFGAGFGMTELSPHLGMFVKGHDLTPEELKHVMLFK